MYFQPKTEKRNITIEFNIFRFVQVPNFTLNSVELWDQIGPNCFWSKTEKANIITEFCIFELDYVPNFRLTLIRLDFLRVVFSEGGGVGGEGGSI